jgi:hypothetical protein
MKPYDRTRYPQSSVMGRCVTVFRRKGMPTLRRAKPANIVTVLMLGVFALSYYFPAAFSAACLTMA